MSPAAAGVAAEAAERDLRLLGVETAARCLSTVAPAGSARSHSDRCARGATVIASASQANHDYLREIGAIPVLYGQGLVTGSERFPTRSHAVLDVAGKTPIEELIALAPEPAQVVSIANFSADDGGCPGDRGQGQPAGRGLAQAARLLQSGKLVIKVQTSFSRAAEAYQLNQSGHIRGKLVLIPEH